MIKAIRQWFENRQPEEDPYAFSTGPNLSFSDSNEIPGISLTNESALTVAPFFSCVSMIADSVASSKLQLHDLTPELGQPSVLGKHQTNHVVERQANRNDTAFDFWRYMVLRLEVLGNAFAWIDRDKSTNIIQGLYPLQHCQWNASDSMDPHYIVTVDGEASRFEPGEILHLRGHSLTLGRSISPVDRLRNEIRLALGETAYRTEQAKRGFKVAGSISIPTGTPVAARERLEQQVKKNAESREHWLSTIVLRDGAKWNTTGQTNADATLTQLEESISRRVCMSLGVPPEKIGLTSSMSYNSASQSNAVFISQTLLPRFRAITSECNSKLIPSRDYRNGSRAFRHDVDSLVESDVTQLADTLLKLRGGGVLTANECRSKLGYTQLADPLASVLLNPATTDMSEGEA